jgi:hypothetical protein
VSEQAAMPHHPQIMILSFAEKQITVMRRLSSVKPL